MTVWWEYKAEKKKGPGRGWWGPDKGGTHGARGGKQARPKPDHAKGARLTQDEWQREIRDRTDALLDSTRDDARSSIAAQRKKTPSVEDVLEKNPWGLSAGVIKRLDNDVFDGAQEAYVATLRKHRKTGSDDATAESAAAQARDKWVRSDEAWESVYNDVEGNLYHSASIRAAHELRVDLAKDTGTIKASGKMRPASDSSKSKRDWGAYDENNSADLDGAFTTAEVHQQKASIAGDLSERTGIPKDSTSQFVKEWAITSNDNQYASLHTQEMASELFDVELSPWQREKLTAAESKRLSTGTALLAFEKGGYTLPREAIGSYGSDLDYDSHNDASKAVLRGMYDSTQEWFADKGYKPGDTVRLFRGVGSDASDRGGRAAVGDTKEYRSNVLESWSVNPEIARRFTGGSSGKHGQVFSADVPIERILSNARTGFGCLNEWEFVVIGSNEPDEYRVVYDARSGVDWEGE